MEVNDKGKKQRAIMEQLLKDKTAENTGRKMKSTGEAVTVNEAWKSKEKCVCMGIMSAHTAEHTE